MQNEKRMWMYLFRYPNEKQWRWAAIGYQERDAHDEWSINYHKSKGRIMRIDEFVIADDDMPQMDLIEYCYFHHNGEGVENIVGFVRSDVYYPDEEGDNQCRKIAT